jgi:hypothetical protein
MNKIFGIGFHRTGTTSLTFALQMLGIKTIHWPNDEETYKQLIRGDYKLKIMKNYQSANDLTITPFFKQLDKEFPNSKFILTVRNLNSWLNSVRVHWGNETNRDIDKINSHFEKVTSFSRIANFGCLTYSETRLKEVYEDHIDKVNHYFKDRPNDLLVLNICNGEGWEKLCPFLKKEIPHESFPHRNQNNYKIF